MHPKHRLSPILRLCLPAAILVIAACTCSGLTSLPVTGPTAAVATQEPTRSEPTAEPTSTEALPPSDSNGPLDQVTFQTLPARDRYDLAARFKGITDAKPTHTSASLPKVGDEQQFWVDNTTSNRTNRISAKLVYADDHVAMWVQDGLNYDLGTVTQAAQRFSQKTYPTDRSYFGSEPLPGIDGDPRVYILNTDQMGSDAAGYFNSPSEYPASIVPNSNEHEMFYMNWDAARPGTQRYNAILAHEFQHMIEWNVDKNEDSWFNEGMSELAAFLNGFGVSGFVPSYMEAPETQLDGWQTGGGSLPHYGAGFLFNAYFLDRFGQDDLRKLVANQDNGLQAYDSTLALLSAGVTTEDLFKDWMIANLLDNTKLDDGHYGYHQMPNLPKPRILETVSSAPDLLDEKASQYGANYIQIEKAGTYKLHFTGSQRVLYLPTAIGEGSGAEKGEVWWSTRGDDSDMSLTRQVDLTNVGDATLEFDLWYALEDGWDYGYVEASPDGGKSWQMLRTDASSTKDPHGNSYGPGYTGLSSDQPDGATSGGWLHQTASLGLFKGKKIQLRFETITDDSFNLQGMALDNICIQAIQWCDDAESQDPAWDAKGFVRIHNSARQVYTVQVVVPQADGSVQVDTLPLDEANSGDLTVTVGSQPATVVISGLTRFTDEKAPYHLDISTGG